MTQPNKYSSGSTPGALNRQPSLVLLLVVGLKYLIAAALFATHLKNREHRIRPFLAVGGGMKGYVVAGPAPSPSRCRTSRASPSMNGSS